MDEFMKDFFDFNDDGEVDIFEKSLGMGMIFGMSDDDEDDSDEF